ncbi:hypothetical protein KXD97_13270 [Mycobacterium sp. SMC-8]|nr:hypothetical protein KXD97_13270 [Mycobacterium sp. SMC-8]
MKRHTAILARLLTAICPIILLTSPMASAQPPGDPGVSSESTLPLVQLGGRPNLAFYGIQGTQTVTFPVSQGLEPVALNAFTQLPVNVRTATVTAIQDGRTIGRVDVAPGAPAPIAIPLDRADVVDNAVTVTLRTYLLPMEGYCLDPTNALELSDPSVTFAGAEQTPSTVADFLPPVLRQLTIFVDEQPSPSESDAVVQLATAVASRYGAQNPTVTVAPLANGQTGPTEPSGPLARHVVVAEGDDVGLSLLDTGGVPALRVGGPGDELTNQARLLTGDLAPLALSAKAVAGQADSNIQLPGDKTTLRGLGQPGSSVTAVEPQLNLGLDQTRLGRAVHGIRVHLRGSSTPLPQSVGGQVVISIGDENIDRWPTDSSGEIDRWVDVPDHLLQRFTNMTVALDISGGTGYCQDFEPATLTIDGDSPVVSTAAASPVPGGFQSLPQTLMPRTVVGVGEGFDNVRRAFAIMVGLQRLSGVPIDTAVMSLADAVSDGAPAVLISPDEWTDPGIALPVAAGDGGELTVKRADAPGETTTLTLDPALGFGSLQTVHDGRRSVLVATSHNAPEQLDLLLDWLGSDVRRWQSLSGTALIGAPGTPPVMLDTMPEPVIEAEQSVTQVAAPGTPSWVWVAVAGVAILIIVAVVSILLRGRRRRPERP